MFPIFFRSISNNKKILDRECLKSSTTSIDFKDLENKTYQEKQTGDDKDSEGKLENNLGKEEEKG